MADAVYLGPIATIRDLSWGGEPALLVFLHDSGASGAARSMALVIDREGRYRKTIEGLADVVVSGPGEVTGLRVTEAGMALFRQPTTRPFPLPDAQGVAFPWMEGARLIGHRTGGWLLQGLLGGLSRWRLGLAEPGESAALFAVPTVVRDPMDNTTLGSVEVRAGVAALGSHLVVGTHCQALIDGQVRAPLALETADDWASHRLVEAEAPSGDGPVTWRTSAVTAWGGRFWVVATRTTASWTRHRLYAFSPGGPAVLVSETGWVDRTGLTPHPHGLMIRLPSDAIGPLDPSGHGGAWSGGCLVLGAVRCAENSPWGLCVAGGTDGLLVVDGVGSPRFHPGPEGITPLAALPLGGETSGSSSWLCRTRDGQGGIGSALTPDFQSWTLDPFPGDPAPLGGVTTPFRWGLFGPGTLS
ncbi:MAG: hypothetical protein K9H25_16275 [Rhodospirillum sp.]|nr:hypothetical protein [Rhodospirillum sp.]MCF8489637.1 hypothetical protein [Rhodospirillum sp.]MCF8500559.1 hypothetical protein [Rhodospirillum sp.]